MATTTLNPRTIDQVELKPKGRFEELVGPEVYRILHGLVTNPMSVTGIAIIGIFALIAVLAPVLAPPPNSRDSYLVPRDGFGPNPAPPGTIW